MKVCTLACLPSSVLSGLLIALTVSSSLSSWLPRTALAPRVHSQLHHTSAVRSLVNEIARENEMIAAFLAEIDLLQQLLQGRELAVHITDDDQALGFGLLSRPAER